MVTTGLRTSALVISLVLAAGTAEAQDANEARTLFEQGVSAASGERWDEAIDAFTRSFALVERASTAYNLAVALGHLDRVRDALAALDDYFRLANQGDQGEAQRYAQATELRTRLEPRVAHLALTVSPESASVEIDGTAAEGSGATRDLVLDPGTHRVRVVDGERSEEIEVTVAAGENATRNVTIGAGTTAQSGGGDAFGTLGLVGVIVAGVGVAAGLVALGTGIASNETYNRLLDECGPTHVCPAGYEEQISVGSALALSSTIFTVIGGVALAAGLTLLTIDLVDGGGGEQAQLELTPGPTLAGLGARVRF